MNGSDGLPILCLVGAGSNPSLLTPPVRGAIDVGPLYVDDDIVWGSGLL
jgi:hypothetical protein